MGWMPMSTANQLLLNDSKTLIADHDGVLMPRKTARPSIKQAAKKLGTTVSIITKMLKIAKEQGLDALKIARWGGGRPRQHVAPTLRVAQLNWLASMQTLRSQIGLSLIARCAQFNQYWAMQVSLSDFRRLYSCAKISKQKIISRLGGKRLASMRMQEEAILRLQN